MRSGPPDRCRDPVPRVADELGAQGGQRRRVGDLVRGGPRAGVGIWCLGSPMSSAPRVATGGGWVIWCAVG
ncbi:hypothetical protein ACK303_18220, partial [Aeromonas caviae]